MILAHIDRIGYRLIRCHNLIERRKPVCEYLHRNHSICVGWHLHVITSVPIACKLGHYINEHQCTDRYAIKINATTDVNPIRFFSMAKS